jgi:GDPmannose 4,6-dehydratase
MEDRTAVIFGVTGQDGSYLLEHLLNLGYRVVGVRRRSSTMNDVRIPYEMLNHKNFTMIEGDVTDVVSVQNALSIAESILNGSPNEVYDLAAQSQVGTSFNQPLFTWRATAEGTMNILGVIVKQGWQHQTRFFHASSSEMFGDAYTEESDGERYQDEDTPFQPCSPYGVAKVAAHHTVALYRKMHDMFACSLIMFNHESPRRGEYFVTRKITRYIGELRRAILEGRSSEFHKLELGNLSACRDWSHALDMVRAMHLVLQQPNPIDYVVSSGNTYSIEDFCRFAFGEFGLDYKNFVVTNDAFVRPCEVPFLRGCSDRIRYELGWRPEVTFKELVHEMVAHDAQLPVGWKNQ